MGRTEESAMAEINNTAHVIPHKRKSHRGMTKSYRNTRARIAMQAYSGINCQCNPSVMAWIQTTRIEKIRATANNLPFRMCPGKSKAIETKRDAARMNSNRRMPLGSRQQIVCIVELASTLAHNSVSNGGSASYNSRCSSRRRLAEFSVFPPVLLRYHPRVRSGGRREVRE